MATTDTTDAHVHDTYADSGSTPDLTIRPRSRLPRHICSGVLAALAVYVGFNVATNPRFGWSVVGDYLFDPQILEGLRTTLLLTFGSAVFGIVLGVVIAVMRLSRIAALSVPAWLFAVFFRGTPQLVQIIFWYNLAALYPHINIGIPGVFSILKGDANAMITPLTAGLLALGINQAAYMSEIVRAGLLGVDRGQADAAAALGMPPRRVLRRVILPQAMRTIIPPMGNEVIGLLKGTALVSMIAVSELLFTAQVIYNQNLEIIPLLIVVSIWYLVVTTVMSIGQFYLERHFGRGAAHPTSSLTRVWWDALTRAHARTGKAEERS